MNIVMVPFHDYKKWINEGFRTRDAHLCQHLENSDEVNKILVINRPVSLAERIVKRMDWKTPSLQIVYKRNGVQLAKMSDKVWCLDIALRDFFKVAIQKKAWWFTAFEYKLVIDEINYALKKLNMENGILLLQNPMAIGVAKNVMCSKFVFDAIDNWLYHPQMQNKELIKKNYEYVENNADLILTVSKALTTTFANNTNVHWIPNGVDVEYFEAAINKKDFTQKTVVGYVGKIQDRVDFDMIEECLKTFPDVDFVFLGPVYSQKEKAKKLMELYKNIQFKGDIHYNELPEQMKMFDVAIIPHKVDEFTNSMNPLKLYEYLASGKIVVTSEVAGTDNISPYVLAASENHQFILNLKHAIEMTKKSNYDPQEVVLSVPKSCQWINRVENIIQLLK